MAQTGLIFIISMLVMGGTATLVMGVRARRANRAFSTASMGISTAPPTMRDLEMDRSAGERLLRPLIRRAHRIGKILTPSRSIAEIQRNLIMAGNPGNLTVSDFLGLRFLAAVALSGIAYFLIGRTGNSPLALLTGVGLFGAGLYAPNFWLKSKVKQRQYDIAISLPGALDMMSICVEAGLGFEAAMQKVAENSDDALAVELRRVISEIRVGIRRIDALRHLVDRTGVDEIASFVAVLAQSDKLGIAIKDVLNTQAVQMRIKRRQRAEEAARKAPLKMLFPLTFFIFPALFIVLLGPVVPQVLELWGG